MTGNCVRVSEGASGGESLGASSEVPDSAAPPSAEGASPMPASSEASDAPDSRAASVSVHPSVVASFDSASAGPTASDGASPAVGASTTVAPSSASWGPLPIPSSAMTSTVASRGPPSKAASLSGDAPVSASPRFGRVSSWPEHATSPKHRAANVRLPAAIGTGEAKRGHVCTIVSRSRSRAPPKRISQLGGHARDVASSPTCSTRRPRARPAVLVLVLLLGSRSSRDRSSCSSSYSCSWHVLDKACSSNGPPARRVTNTHRSTPAV